MMLRRLALVSLLVIPAGCASFKAAACGGPDDPGAPEVVMPEEIAGLKVKLDKKATKAINSEDSFDATYQCPGGGEVYALRKNKELRAVLQISRLAPDARLDDIDFLRGLVKGPTGNVLEPIEVNCVDVYPATSSGNERTLTMWFTDRFMFFLTTRENQTLPGVAVGVDFDRVLSEAVLIGPPGHDTPEPGECPPPVFDPIPTEIPTDLPTVAPSADATVGITTEAPTPAES
jgi:hypothetical protein